MNQDLLIAQSAKLEPITRIAETAGIPQDCLEPYGRYKAKVRPNGLENKGAGKLVLVTAISPTPAGEGKTTVSIGLADGLARLGAKAMLALREPSLGPVFGVKGGAAGGGYAQIAPMEDINLHFTGDLHAITSANNLLAALTDNHIHQGNALGIDTTRVAIRRCLDMNDRQLRQIVSGIGSGNGVPREDGFDITAACQVMAAFCLAGDIADLKLRLGRIVVGYTRAGAPVTAADLGAQGAMTALLRDAFYPNLVQTLEGTPALVHGGPFANIAHGCNSVAATRMALSLADICVTEAGFGADLGAEKFLDIKCRQAGLSPSCAVVVATVRALKHHGGCKKENLSKEGLASLAKGLPNLLRHVENLKEVYGLPVVVAVNRFATDTQAELDMVGQACDKTGTPWALADVWAKGGEGAEALAKEVLRLTEGPAPQLQFCYPADAPLEEKIRLIAKRVYRAERVTFLPGVLTQLRKLPQELLVCIAKTQYSFSDDPKKLAAPEGFAITIRKVGISAGAGFAVAFAGDIIAMPGLPPKPAAQEVDVDEDSRIVGIF